LTAIRWVQNEAKDKKMFFFSKISTNVVITPHPVVYDL
jgi:hypothetical protein